MAAGFTQQQAEVQAQALAEVIDEQIATKRDIEELKVALKHDIKESEHRLTIRMLTIIGSAMVLTVSLTVSLVKLL